MKKAIIGLTAGLALALITLATVVVANAFHGDNPPPECEFDKFLTETQAVITFDDHQAADEYRVYVNTIRVDGVPADDGMVFSLTLPVRRDSYAYLITRWNADTWPERYCHTARNYPSAG